MRYPVTMDKKINFHVKGRCDVDQEFKQVGFSVGLLLVISKNFDGKWFSLSHEKILLTITILVLFCIVIFWQKRYGAAAEFTVFIPDFKKDQDVRLKVGYEIFDKVIIIIFFW